MMLQLLRIFGISKKGRKDMHVLLIQAAQVVLRHKSQENPLHTWGWEIHFRKGRNIAVAAVACKIAVAIWCLLMGKPFKAKEKTISLVRRLTDIAKLFGKNEVIC